MAKVPNGVQTLPKISIASVGARTLQTTDDRQTDRQTDDRHIANVNVSFKGELSIETQCRIIVLRLRK